MKAPLFLNEYAHITEEALNKFCPESSRSYKKLVDAMRYSLLNGGKRIRAALCLEFCRVCGGKVSDAIDFACALEMIHAYSLIHDDLPAMDDDDMRRGKPSCHIAFGECTAILAGDALQALAFETALSSNNIFKNYATVILAKAAGYNGMVGGQEIDTAFEGQNITREQLSEIQSLKTGALISASAQMGCIAAGASEEKLKAAKKYAEKIGLVFQMVDDILDVTADEKTLGKPIGSDAEQDKVTFVTLLGIEKTRSEAKRINDDAIKSLDIFGDKANGLIELAEYLLNRAF